VKRLESLGASWCWRTFQHRVDATVDFNRDWTDYVSGFGQGEDRNFWMGLQAIHLLTRAGDRRVRWEMSSWNGSWWWWENAVLIVEDASQEYRVTVGKQDVDRSNVIECPKNALESMDNQKFSTKGNDQDSYSYGSCANLYRSGWWFKSCFCFNPNGIYYSPPTALDLSRYDLLSFGISFSGSVPPDPSMYPLDYRQSMKTFDQRVGTERGRNTAMLHINILALFIGSASVAAATFMSSEWRAQRDDLAEYLVDRAVRTASRIQCASLASERHQAVSFSSDEAVCRLLSCRLGRSGCRKCRNAAKSGLPLLMVRRLESLGASWCWRTFQHRVDATVDFNRDWTDYVSGFGQGEDRNFWMGLQAIHLLTRAGDRRVRWEMSSWNGSWWWWENAELIVEDASQGYRVTVGEQDVDRSNVIECRKNGWQSMDNQKFSTPDVDQDGNSGVSCAN
uniref:Fibrinogen C-terminal domain-containing protein n=1 Tax=Macrostomum lignano TaxID=282301 RepID=A0A1I8GCZ1_9PLAT